MIALFIYVRQSTKFKLNLQNYYTYINSYFRSAYIIKQIAFDVKRIN